MPKLSSIYGRSSLGRLVATCLDPVSSPLEDV
jgi:hypothetical protein